MKSLKLITLFAAFALIFSSCGEDTDIGGGGSSPGAPSVFLSSNGEVSSDVSLPLNSTFSVILEASKGDMDMQALTITEDGSNLDISRFTINGETQGANPKLLFDDDTQSFTFEISIDAQNEINDFKTYTFTVQDMTGNNDSVSISVSTAGGNVAPSITLDNDAYSSTPDLAAIIDVSASTGDSRLSTISLQAEDDGVFNEISDLTSIAFGSSSENFTSNPLTLSEEDKDGFNKLVFVNPDFFGTGNYRIIITDEAGNTASTDFTITNGTSVSNTLMGVLFNAGGPQGTGGLDLDNGVGTGSMDADAEIRDAGIDLSLPDANNWIQRIGGVNSTSVRKVDPSSLAEGIGFAQINFTELIDILHSDASDFTNSDMNGLLSDTVQEGDVFAVKSDSRVYLIEITEVNQVAADNSDNYVLNIKY